MEETADLARMDEWIRVRFGEKVFAKYDEFRQDPENAALEAFDLLEMAQQHVYQPELEAFTVIGAMPCNSSEILEHVETDEVVE